jgi:integrase
MAYKVSVSKYRWKEGTPWAVNIPATVGGKRRREFFKTRLAAEQRRSELTDKITYQGINAIRAGSLPVGEAIEDYLANKAGLSQRHLEGLLLYCGRMRAAWGKLPVSSISFRDVEKFLRNPSWGPRTRWNALTHVRAFLSWCERRRLTTENPAKTLAEEFRKPESPKEILSPDEMRLLLRLTRRTPALRAFVAIGGFAGIRTSGIQRLQWSDISHGEIHVPRHAMKGTKGWRKEQYVRIEPVLERHLPRRKMGLVIPWTVRKFGIEVKKLRQRMGKVAGRINAPWAGRWQKNWPDNCLRHSFASYHLAMWEDAGKTAYQMGHTNPQTVYQNYFRAVRKSAAQRWWAMG